MEFVIANWGSLTSAIGVIVSLVGLVWVFIEARGARTASQAAQEATRETNSQIARYLQTVDLERAIGLIQRIKLLHNTSRWEAAMEQYQSLRMMLSDIIARCPENQTEFRDELATARTIVRDMENFVGEYVGQSIGERERSILNRRLNDIQSDLEELASGAGIGHSLGET